VQRGQRCREIARGLPRERLRDEDVDDAAGSCPVVGR
jgi:hypothetical protein